MSGYDEKIDLLLKKINQLEIENENNKNKISHLNNKLNEANEILNSNHELFKTIFLDSKLESRGILQLSKEVVQELLNLVVNICKKNHLEYWLDFGTLIGAVRHENFIPWDDDIDISMMRKDYNVMLEIIEDEIKNLHLDDCLKLRIDVKRAPTWIHSFLQIMIWSKSGNYLGALDIFPHDYLIEYTEDTEKFYMEEKLDFHVKLLNGIPRNIAEKEYYQKLNLSYEKQKYILPGVEDMFGGENELHPFVVYETDEIFPLRELTFNNIKYFVPNNYHKILKKEFNDYWNLPKIIKNHNLIDNSRDNPNIKKEYQYMISKLKITNDYYFNEEIMDDYYIESFVLPKKTKIYTYDIDDIEKDQHVLINGKLLSDEKVISNKQVRIIIDDVEYIVETNFEGYYKYDFVPKNPGEFEVNVLFDGDDGYYPSSCKSKFTVLDKKI